MCRLTIVLSIVFGTAATFAQQEGAVRIKDITDIEGVRSIELTGIGLVTGLQGTGGTTPATRELASNLLQRFGLRLNPALRDLVRDDTRFITDNMSVVTVTARMPDTAMPGSQIDVSVASFDDAESLLGGKLVMTPLSAVDGQIYATASGSVILGGFNFSGDAATASKNHATSGIITNGGLIQKAVHSHVKTYPRVRLLLRTPDFETASRISQVINGTFPNSAKPLNNAVVDVMSQQNLSNVQLISQIQKMSVVPDVEARVIINERTGTVVMGEHVKISKAAITHANLAVITGESPQVSQPEPFSDGETVVVPRTEIDVVEDDQPIQVFEAATTVQDLAQAMNALGVSPRDISSIFQSLKSSGALHAKLEFQ